MRYLYLKVIGIILLALVAGSFAFPGLINKAIDGANSVFGFIIPHFPEQPFHLGLDLQGGTHLLYEADLSGIENENKSTAMQGLRDVIERRVNLFGVSEPVVAVQESGDHYRLAVELAGITNPNQAIELIGQTPFLEFKTERPAEERQEILDAQAEIQDLSLEEARQHEKWSLAISDPNFVSTELTGQYLEKAEIAFDSQSGVPLILLQFDSEGSEIFERMTAQNIGRQIAIYIDGTPISAPVVQDVISGGRAQINGDFTVAAAKEIARNLNAGALPVPISLVNQQSIGPTLGEISVNESLKAGIIGFVAIILFLIAYYRLPGLLAAFSLLIYITLVLSLFKLIPVTLTLAGIGGFVLSIGMAVDANILIFSRMREELSKEQSFAGAIEEGFKRSWSSIRDGNITTLIVALILFILGTSFIQGFALTLSIGIVVSMFSAILVTRTLLRIFVGTMLEKWRFLWI